jgi:hypothetical protein
MRLALVLLVCLFGLPADAADESSPAWRNAMTSYKAGEFAAAAEEFKKIAADEKQISAALCHNLANAEYKLGEAAGESTLEQKKTALGHFAAASLWYRRALALDPMLSEARQNLRFLHTKRIGYHAFEPEGLVKFASWFPRWKWLAVLQGALWAAARAIVWLVWATPRPGRRWPLVTLLCLSLAVVVTTGLGLAGKSIDKAPLTKRLVSMEPVDGMARVAPAEAAASVIPLPPGSEVIPVKEEGYWTYCDIPGGARGDPLRGWIRTKTTERLWPWNPALVE